MVQPDASLPSPWSAGLSIINHTEQGWHAASGSGASHGPGSCPPTLCPRVIHHSPELCSLLSRGQACCTQCQLSDPWCQVVTHALQEETRNNLSHQTSGSQTRVCMRMSQGLVKLRWLNATPGISDLIGLGGQSTATAPYLGRGVSPHAVPSDLERGIALLGPPAPTQPPTAPWRWVCSSRLPPLALGVAQRSPEGPRHLHRIPRLSEAPWEVP